MYYAPATRDFWDVWHAQKEYLRANGISCLKPDCEWMVSFTVYFNYYTKIKSSAKPSQTDKAEENEAPRIRYITDKTYIE
jgi:hypothetical protein